MHQDGFDHIAMLGVNRCNSVGGELLVYDSHDAEPFVVYSLDDGNMALLDDKKLWHNAKPLLSNRVASDDSLGYVDFLIFCAKV